MPMRGIVTAWPRCSDRQFELSNIFWFPQICFLAVLPAMGPPLGWLARLLEGRDRTPNHQITTFSLEG